MAPQSGVYSRWSREVERERFFHPGERVGVAVSGGPDSVLLLDFMARLARRAGLTLAVVHFNHKLRGAESDADEEFVRKLARAGDWRFLRNEADVSEAARKARGNLEAVARALRYRYFFSLIRQGELDKIATAHTANDQAETVLLRLLRGTGTRGLGGIFPVLDGKIVRPFLSLTRPEVEREIRERGLAFRPDPTNLDPRFRRNKIRADLLPRLEREYNPELVKLLNELAERARSDEAFLEEQARERGKAWRVREEGKEKIPLRALEEFPAVVARRVLRQMIQAVRGSLRGLSYRQIESLRQFAQQAQSGRHLLFPGGMTARKDFDWLVLIPPAAGPPKQDFAHPVKVPSDVRVPEIGRIFRVKIVAASELQRGYNDRGVLGLDPSKLPEQMVLRNWRAGDRFHPPGAQKPVKLKEMFRQRRVPSEDRKMWPVLASERGIHWVRGIGAAAEASSRKRHDRMVVIEEGAIDGEP